MKTNELRKKYLDFFKSKGHKIFLSDSLVPDDPSVLFTSAGMNQFKPYFLGEKKDVKRASSCQKCLRTGDLEQVGKTPFHHTFFEMLGNFSFGDYFKQEAIEFAWEFLTKELNINPADLWISVYQDDDQAYDIWHNHVGIDKNKIVRLGQDSNFWPASAPSQGPNGPCGPCSEIFFDRGQDKGCGKNDCSPACNCRRFVEVWNLVFTQFNRVGENKLEPLPQNNIDTGMGLERMAAVLQNKYSNFEIDIFSPIVEFVEEKLGFKNTNDPRIKSIVYLIVDHIRAATFSITDGVYPSNEERGYVVRKLIRIALAKIDSLKYKDSSIITKLPDYYVNTMGDFYPEIGQRKDFVKQILQAEEEKFLLTLDEGKRKLNVIIDGLKKKQQTVLPAQDCFYLYDTYGFPLELSQDIAQEVNISIDEVGFRALMLKQQQRSRQESKFDPNIFKKGTFSSFGPSEFIGYDNLAGEVNVLGIIENTTKDKKDSLEFGQEGCLVLDRTPFYPESGGQLNDKGIIITSTGEFLVEYIFKENDVIIHSGKVVQGVIKIDKAQAKVDCKRRKALMRAHTATHLLQTSLRQVLGQHIMQQGSLVDEDRLRFDFTHFKALTSQELLKVEELVNNFIFQGNGVEKQNLSYQEAKDKGALAFFKDKYKDQVRVVSIGNYSKELCGGTHLDNTQEIGMFFIIGESSISSGVRRIEAVVGLQGQIEAQNLRKQIKDIAGILHTGSADLTLAINKLLEEQKDSQNKIEALGKRILDLELNGIIKNKQDIDGIGVLTYKFTDKSNDTLLYLADCIRSYNQATFLFFISQNKDKNIFLCAVTEELVKKGLTAKDFVATYKDKLGIKGGGKDSLVQGVISQNSDDLLVKVEDCFKEWKR